VRGLVKDPSVAEEIASYNQIVMDHLKHPRNKGEMENPDGVGEAQNPVCGDTMRLFIRVQTDRIVDARFLTFGCGAAIASSSITTEMIKGRTIEEVLMISDQAIADALGGLPPAKIHCSVLAEKAIQAAVSDYRKKNPSPSPSPLGGEGWREGNGRE
jgi:nitrogen fixation NifU-like protein